MAEDQDRGSHGVEAEFEELFADAADKARAKGAAEENLDELEAFLDAFEKDPDAASAASDAPRADAAAQASPPVVDFSAPEHVEALVHGLLKDDDFDLEVGKQAAPQAAADAEPDTGAEPDAPVPAAPLTAAEKASPSMSTTQRPSPLAIAAVTMSTVALLVAIGAGWATFGAGNETASSAPTLDAATSAELAALKKRVAELAARMEGPVGDITDSYPRDMDALGKRVDDLHAALVSIEQQLAAAPATPPAPEAPAEVAAAAKPQPVKAPAAAPQPTRETWQVNLVSFTERAGADVELKRARGQGLDAQIVPAEREGRTWYRVAVSGFASADAARGFVGNEARKAGYSAAWIARP